MIASLQSVGTASTLAFAGVYLHRRGLVIGPDSKKTLALLSHQITIPLILFTNLVKCTPERYNPDICFTATDQLKSGLWILLLWPLYVMTMGFLIGLATTMLTKTSEEEKKVVLSGSSFGGAIAIPLVLATSIVRSLPPSSPILITDPSTVLAVYLITDNTIKFVIGGLIFPRFEKNRAGEEEEPQRENNANSCNKVKIALMSFLQPPVIASFAGVVVLSIPQLRGIFVNLHPESHHTVPFEWLFNGMVSIGASTVPITMIILGINLSIAAGSDSDFTLPIKSVKDYCCQRFLRRDDGGSGRGRSTSDDNSLQNVGLPTVTATNNNDNSESAGNTDNNTGAFIRGSIIEERMSRRTVILTVIGKMLLMPVSPLE